MTETTDFIAELFRAANEVGKLNPFERRRLLERAANTLREMRSQAGDREARGLLIAGDRWDAKAAIADQMSDEEVKGALLVVADQIRINRILLDAKDEVTKQ